MVTQSVSFVQQNKSAERLKGRPAQPILDCSAFRCAPGLLIIFRKYTNRGKTLDELAKEVDPLASATTRSEVCFEQNCRHESS